MNFPCLHPVSFCAFHDFKIRLFFGSDNHIVKEAVEYLR